ncbi:MAG: hypothetical protein Q7S00_00285, partial [bacterium]|nr:hypothetical protein [bacterium]
MAQLYRQLKLPGMLQGLWLEAQQLDPWAISTLEFTVPFQPTANNNGNVPHKVREINLPQNNDPSRLQLSKNIPSDNAEKCLLEKEQIQEAVLQQSEPLSEDEIKERA